MPITKTIAAALMALTALVAAAPAQAHSSGGPTASFSIQFGTASPAHFRAQHGRWGLLSPRQVEFSLRRQGFHRVRVIDARAPVYRAVAISPRGGRVALKVSARSGRILHLDRIGPRHHHRGGRGYY